MLIKGKTFSAMYNDLLEGPAKVFTSNVCFKIEKAPCQKRRTAIIRSKSDFTISYYKCALYLKLFPVLSYSKNTKTKINYHEACALHREHQENPKMV